MRFRPDATLRRVGPTVRLGGSPLRLWRLSSAGAALVDRMADGDDVHVPPDSPVAGLVERLTDAGVLHPDPTSESVGGAPPLTPIDVTVVIPVRDRPEQLERLLVSLAPTAAAGARVIVVDDGSVDDAAHAAVAAAHGAEVVRHVRSGGPAAARNIGLARVATPLVAFVDSDCTIPTSPPSHAEASGGPWWVSPLALLGDPRVAVVAPRVRSQVPDGAAEPTLLQRFEALRSPLDLGAEPARVAPGTRVSYVPAAALVARTDALRSVDGFDDRLRVGEDVDLIWRLVAAGHLVRYEPTSVVEHPARGGPVGWLRQRVGYGTSAAALDERHPWEVAPVRCSPWSAAGWALIGLAPSPFGPVAGIAVMAASASALPRRLSGVPTAESLCLAVIGHLGAGRQLARAVVRVWWPIALPLAVIWRPARRAVVASVAVVALDAAVALRRSGVGRSEVGPSEPGGTRSGLVDTLAIGALAVADDAAYGAGVWLGCIRAGRLRALLPRFPRSAGRL